MTDYYYYCRFQNDYYYDYEKHLCNESKVDTHLKKTKNKMH